MIGDNRRPFVQMALAGLVTALVAGCGSSATVNAPPSHSAHPAVSQRSTTPRPTAEGVHGIILANENTASSVTLYAVNPTTGAASGTWTFNPGGNTSPVDPQTPGWLWRQKFNADFTELAAPGPQAADAGPI